MKAESDILCTSRNAAKVVNSIPASQSMPVLFLPDINLGNWVEVQTEPRENMRILAGACIVHSTFLARKLSAARARHPRAKVAAHPECTQDVLTCEGGFSSGSTTAIIDWCVQADAEEIIVMTESGVQHSLHRLAPDKRFLLHCPTKTAIAASART